MTVHLPANLENSILDAVRSGHFASVDEAMAEAARLLLTSCQPTRPARALTLEELDRQMLAEGLMSQLPDATLDIIKDDEPVVIEGEPLSETIIRERR